MRLVGLKQCELPTRGPCGEGRALIAGNEPTTGVHRESEAIPAKQLSPGERTHATSYVVRFCAKKAPHTPMISSSDGFSAWSSEDRRVRGKLEKPQVALPGSPLWKPVSSSGFVLL